MKTSIASWTTKVPQRQWAREDKHLDEIGPALPAAIADSKPLGEVHRLDLSLFVIFEEAALRVSGALTRSAPTVAAMNFAAQQTLDEARHHEVFLDRLGVSRGTPEGTHAAVDDAIMIPPLQRFLERSYEVVDRGEFIEGMVLMNLIFEGMSYPLYAYEQRYWATIDPFLTRLIKNAFADESRHVVFGADLVRELLGDDAARRDKVRALVKDMTALMNEVFAYYVKKFVKLFDAVARRHADLFAGAEFAPGKLISQTPYQDQIAAIHASITEEHARILARAGLA